MRPLKGFLVCEWKETIEGVSKVGEGFGLIFAKFMFSFCAMVNYFITEVTNYLVIECYNVND